MLVLSMNSEQERGPRGELGSYEAHEMAMSLPMSDVVRHLVEYLGATTVAAIGGVNETRAVREWMEEHGREPQRPHTLRFALQVASMIATEVDPAVVRAWFQGSNPYLNDEIPALLLRDRPLYEIQRPMLVAARSFAARS
jgi:hypothetical protein